MKSRSQRIRTPRDVGAFIREGRRTLGLDQGSFAKKVGVSRLWINEIEKGKSGASLGLVLRALSAGGIELTGRTGAGDFFQRPAGAPDINAIIERARAPK